MLPEPLSPRKCSCSGTRTGSTAAIGIIRRTSTESQGDDAHPDGGGRSDGRLHWRTPRGGGTGCHVPASSASCRADRLAWARDPEPARRRASPAASGGCGPRRRPVRPRAAQRQSLLAQGRARRLASGRRARHRPTPAAQRIAPRGRPEGVPRRRGDRGVCEVSTTLHPEGRVPQLGPLQELIYGEPFGEPSRRVAVVDEVLKGYGFPARSSDDIAQETWDKRVMLASLGALTCLMRGTIGEIEAAPGGTALAEAILAESRTVAEASRRRPSEAHLSQTTRVPTSSGSGVTSSMFRDLAAGQPVEADHILGDLLVRAYAHGLATPRLSAAFADLSIYGRRQMTWRHGDVGVQRSVLVMRVRPNDARAARRLRRTRRAAPITGTVPGGGPRRSRPRGGLARPGSAVPAW